RPAGPLDPLALVPADADRQPDHRVGHLPGRPGSAPAAPGAGPAPAMTIETLAAEAVARNRAALVALLVDAVDGGASIGFLPPLAESEAGAYWDGVVDAVRDGSRLVLVARAAGDGVIGSVQLDLAGRPNARHRAEVVRLMVHRAARRQGLGRALMLAVEDR